MAEISFFRAGRPVDLEYSVEKPLNREPPVEELVKSFLTPPEVAYDRNHGPLPHLDASTHTLTITGLKAPVTLSIADLSTKFPQHSVLAALQCAGNRRHTMRTKVREVDGLDWNDGAVCNASWEGPLLKDVLKSVGVTEDEAGLKSLGLWDEEKRRIGGHVWFESDITKAQDDELYGVSVDLKRCLEEDKKVILALKMNSSPLTVAHGFPLRIVIPGILGARWTKWLTHLRISPTESPNFYQQRDYKILPPHVRSKPAALKYWPLIPALQHLPVNSIVATPSSNSTIPTTHPLIVSGYALPSGDDGPVVNVDISLDGGRYWKQADIIFPSASERASDPQKYKWCWAIWRCEVDISELRGAWKAYGDGSRRGRILSRARDMEGNVQDDTVPWNFRGVAYNAYDHELKNKSTTTID
ncbi:molybdopterin binding oxidoreductase [Ascodesmis nigricans]|uniref:Molybdopterin binding oxidoreductase n=1 Tax=Ascodesmis nigricans TaxID=341454 RepID=A0A4V6RHB0_9PEZI|nr:molybdopterin binding oxidoreductase [Ascodesmis nigricans]